MAIKLRKDLLVKNLILDHKLVTHVDRAIGLGEFEWEAKFEGKKEDDAWHPSGDCLPSPYQLYHSIGQESKPGISLRKSFAVGHFWHQYIQYIVVEKLGFADWNGIERKGIKVWGMQPDEANNPGPKPYQWATGSGDIAPCSIPGHGEYLIDIKTMGVHDFRINGLPSWCAGKYEAQVNIYMDWFHLEQAIIFCIDKNSPHDFKEFLFVRNQPLIDTIYKKWHLVGKCIEENVEPPENYDLPLPLKGPK